MEQKINKNLDPQKLRVQSKYKTSGLTVTSNDKNIIPRDNAGNIVLAENAKNPTLIIEPVATKITTESVLKVLDTRFNFYKFPVTVIETVVDDIDLNIDIEFETNSNIDTELKLPVAVDDKNQINPWDHISTTYDSDWFYSSGFVTKGFKELPFTGDNQLRANAYTLTSDVINILRQQNKTLKFTIQTQYVAQNTSLIQGTNFILRLNRDNIKSYRPWMFPIPQLKTAGTAISAYPVLGMEFILNADDLVDGDYFVINVVADNPAYSLNDKAYWKIEAVDIPTSPPLFGIDNKSGVYNIQGGGTDVILSSITYDSNYNEVYNEIGRKIPGSDAFFK